MLTAVIYWLYVRCGSSLLLMFSSLQDPDKGVVMFWNMLLPRQEETENGWTTSWFMNFCSDMMGTFSMYPIGKRKSHDYSSYQWITGVTDCQDGWPSFIWQQKDTYGFLQEGKWIIGDNKKSIITHLLSVL